MVDNNNSSDPLAQHKCGSLEVAGEGSGQQLVTAHSVDSDLDQPRGRLRTKWHRTVKIGSTTKNFLRQLRQRSQTLDKAASEEAVDRVSSDTERGNSQAE